MMSSRRSVVTIASFTVFVVIAMVLTDTGPNILLVGALCVLGGTSWWIFSELNAAVAHPAPPPAVTEVTTRAGADRRVWVLRDTLIGGRHRDQFDARLHQTLVELIDDQLLNAHNVDRRLDPLAADAILGAELSEFVNGASTRQGWTRPRYIGHIVTLIEEI